MGARSCARTRVGLLEKDGLHEHSAYLSESITMQSPVAQEQYEDDGAEERLPEIDVTIEKYSENWDSWHLLGSVSWPR